MRNLSLDPKRQVPVIIDGNGDYICACDTWSDADYLISLEKEVERLLGCVRELEFDLDVAQTRLNELLNEKGQTGKAVPENTQESLSQIFNPAVAPLSPEKIDPQRGN